MGFQPMRRALSGTGKMPVLRPRLLNGQPPVAWASSPCAERCPARGQDARVTTPAPKRGTTRSMGFQPMPACCRARARCPCYDPHP